MNKPYDARYIVIATVGFARVDDADDLARRWADESGGHTLVRQGRRLRVWPLRGIVTQYGRRPR